MVNRFTKLVLVLAVGIWWQLMFSARAVLAAAQELNLDLAGDPQVTPMPSMVALFFKLLISLLIIVGLMYLTMKVLRKNMKVLSRGININVLDQYTFSLNKGIYITQIVDKVYVLGVTDQNINLITEIGDQGTINGLVTRAREKETGAVLPPGILERFLPGLFRRPEAKNKDFNFQIQKQISRLQSIVDGPVRRLREDDWNE